MNILIALGRSLFSDLQQNSSGAEAGMALTYLKQARQLSFDLHSIPAQCNSLTALGDYYYFIHKPDSARVFYLQVINYYKQTHHSTEEAQTWETMAGATLNLDEATGNLNEALIIYKRHGLKEKEALCIKTLGKFHMRQGKLPLAKSEFLSSLSMQQQIGYKRLSETYALLMEVNKLQLKFDEALKYAMMAVESIKSTNDTLALPGVYENIANLYYATHNSGKAWEFTMKVYEYYIHLSASRPLSMIENLNLFDVVRSVNGSYFKNNQPDKAIALIKKTAKISPPVSNLAKYHYYYGIGDYYSTVGNFNGAEKSYLAMFSYATLSDEEDFYLHARRVLAEFYVKYKKYDKAEPMLKVLFANKAKVNTTNNKLIYLYQYQVDSARGDWNHAFKNYKRYKTISDSLFSEKKNLQFKELQFNYHSAEQEKTISLQRIELNNAREVRRFTIIVISLLIIVVGLLYAGYRVNRRNNKRLKEKNDEIDGQNLLLTKVLETKNNLIGEKEWLMKELNHRVKHNLQIIISLLNFQSKYLKTSEAKIAMQDTQHRIRSMSLVHQKLYQPGSTAGMDMKAYIYDLVMYLKSSLGVSKGIDIKMEIAEVELDVSYAIPLGLIITEAIVNAVKYAFPGTRTGKITILLKTEENNGLHLIIKDNGIGVKEEIDLNQNQSMGVSLIRTFCTQLEATCSFINKDGLTLSIALSYEEPKLRAF
ncbi:MAG: histidine kinase dimerization/phosphoacceptor domain -containing protein [Bacteroidota bacterium]